VDRALVAGALLGLVAIAVVAWHRRTRQPPTAPASVDPAEVGLDGAGHGIAVVGFSSPYCLPCQRWEEALEAAGMRFAKVDVAERPELARRYGVRSTPLVLAVRLPGGEVVESYDGDPRDGDVERLARLAEAGLRRST
jgi:Thioredoxin